MICMNNRDRLEMREIIIRNMFSCFAYSYSLSNSGQSSDFQQNKSTLDSFVIVNENSSKKQRAIVLCDYDAADPSELSLMTDEVGVSL